jgi:regulation of enolase protein 1 (concanavalin A-like superfamily)
MTRSGDLTGLDAAEWLNEPPAWTLADGLLTVTTGDRTDFWQGTWYGFHRDDGHALLAPARGDFTAAVTFDCDYAHLYDQAGLMLRIDRTRWIKLGIEYAEGAVNFSVVVTDGRSDWSIVGRPSARGPQSVRITRRGDAALAQFLDGAAGWTLMRLCPFPDDAPVMVGPMACSPDREGLVARFTAFDVGPALEGLHG